MHTHTGAHSLYTRYVLAVSMSSTAATAQRPTTAILGSTMVRDGLGWEAGVQVGRASSAGRRFCGEGASWAIKYVTERFRPTQAQPVGQTPELAAPRTWSCAAGR